MFVIRLSDRGKNNKFRRNKKALPAMSETAFQYRQEKDITTQLPPPLLSPLPRLP